MILGTEKKVILFKNYMIFDFVPKIILKIMEKTSLDHILYKRYNIRVRLMQMIDKFLNFSIKMKVAVILIPIVIIGSIVGIIVLNKSNSKTELTSATSKTLGLEEEVVLEVKEEVVVVAQDTTIDESLKEKEEEVVKFQDKEVKVPKSKVSSVKSAEDAETNKKTGGDKVSQDQAQTMFENVGKKSMGIDVSHHQGKIDWAQVKASGVEFAIIRAGYRGQTSGGIYEDAYFKTNMKGAIANGIKVGVYFYSTAINETEALEEAAWVVKKIAPYSVTYPVVYDFEDFNSKRCVNVGGAEATRNANTFLNYVKANGYEPMMYANKNDITNRMSRSSFSCKFWLAHYTSQTDYTGNVNMWQYTSKGTVPGISGWVDMNIAYFNYGTVAEPKHTHDYNEEVKNSYTAPTCEKAGSRVMGCSCGDKITEEIPAKKHDWGDWEITIKPTIDTVGERIRICKECKKEVVEELDKLENETNTNTNTNTNTDSDKNANTNTNTNTNSSGNNGNSDKPNTPVHEHSWIIDSQKDATCTENGVINYKCSDNTCMATDSKIVNATGHNFEDGSCTVCQEKDLDYKEPSQDENENNENIEKEMPIIAE